MKKKLILVSLLGLASIANAQWAGPGASNTTGSIYRTGSVGIGMTASPSYPLDVQTSSTGGQGIRVKQNGTSGEASLRLDAVSATGGHHWALHSVGNGYTYPGSLVIRDETDNMPRMLFQPTTGNVGIGTDNPSKKLTIVSGVSDDGMRIVQQTNGACVIRMENQSYAGRDWGLASYGFSSAEGTGNFGIHDYTSGANRLIVNGATGNVGIGTTNASLGRLVVNHDGEPTYNRGIYATALRTTGSSYWNAGIEGRGGWSVGCGGQSYGVIGRAYNGYSNVGGDFTAYPGSCGSRSAEEGGSISIGVYGSGDTHGAYFNGNLEYTGTLTEPSDKKLNDNIKSLENVMDKINLLKPRTYTYKVDEFKDMKLPQGSRVGLIAEELGEVFPEFVNSTQEIIHKDENGEVTSTIPQHRSVNYISLIPVLIAGIQEQQALIGSQQKQIDEQKQLIEELMQKSGSTTGITNNNMVETGFQMSQNEPNPFTHETVVKYTLPQTVSNAFMAVYDLTGKQITTFPITDKGSSSVTITSEKLTAGIYIYSIVADGKVVDSKRMIVAEK